MTSLKAALLVAAASVAFAALPSDAADYPARPVRIIVGFAAGGAPDTLARVVGDKLAQDWGQPVVVENRTGAQGDIAMAAVAKAAAGRLHAGAGAGRQRGGQSVADPQSSL